VGLVGIISVTYLRASLGMEEYGYFESRLFPPITILEGGLPKHPIRIFGKDSLLAILSEIAIPAKAISPLAEAIANFSKLKKAKYLICLGGLSEPMRLSLEKLNVYGVASSGDALNVLKQHNEKVREGGYMVGPYALIMRECAELGVTAMALLVECFPNYPDPEAAAEVLKVFSRITGISVDVSSLIEKGEDIRMKARDLMRRTSLELAKMKKRHEYEVPPTLYV